MATATPIEAWDEVFVRTTRRRANALVVDVALWQLWWPGCRVTPLGDGRADVVWRTRWPVPARHHLVVTPTRVRPRDKGLEFTVEGDVTGSGEWFHLDNRRGVVVSHLLRGECHRPLPRLWVAAHRGTVRSGMTSMKDRLEGGLPPGTEPSSTLLEAQAEELRIFAREVQAHRDELAAAAAGRPGESGGERS